MSILNIKLSFSDDVRRFQAPRDSPSLLLHLAAKSAELFSLEPNRIRLHLSDGTLVISDAQLDTAIDITERGPLLRLAVIEAEPSPTCEVTSKYPVKVFATGEAATFSALCHTKTGMLIPAIGKCLPNGRVVFKGPDAPGNTAMGPKGAVSFKGQEGPWAQWTVQRTADGTAKLLSFGNRDKGWALGFEMKMNKLPHQWMVRRDNPEQGEWMLLHADGSCVWPEPATWHTQKKAAKASRKATKATPTPQLVIPAKTAARASENFHGESKLWNGLTVVEGTHGWAEYDVPIETARTVVIKAQYNAQERRPLRLLIDGTLKDECFASGITGSWTDHGALRWCDSCPVALPAGGCTLRLESDGFFPHLMQLVIEEAQEGVEEQVKAPEQIMLASVLVAGNVDGRTTMQGASLAVHMSNQRDVKDKHASFLIATTEQPKGSIWEVIRGGSVPAGMVSLRVAGNHDGRLQGTGRTLQVSRTDKGPDKRDAHSAYITAVDCANHNKGGLFEIQPFDKDPSLCLLRYAGNIDGRPAARGWYLAAHGSRQRDERDAVSQYLLVTKDSAKASVFDIRPFWGAVPKPKGECDAMGNPKLGFHSAKQAAVPAICSAPKLLTKDPDTTPPPLTAPSAGAAVHALRVACQWIQKKTGLAISVGDMSNAQALATCEALRDLELPKWLLTTNPELQKLSAPRIEAFVAALGGGIQALWAKQDPSLGTENPAAPCRLQEGDKEEAQQEEVLQRELHPEEDQEKWGMVGSRLWVNHGLRATFTVICSGEERQVKLESRGFGYASELFGAPIDSAKIIQVHSKVQPDYIERTPDLAIAPAPAPAPLVPCLDLPSVPTKTDDANNGTKDKDDGDVKDEELVQKLEQLNKMGFGTPRANRHALAAADGSLEMAVDLLLTSDYSMVEADGEGAVEVVPPSYTPQ